MGKAYQGVYGSFSGKVGNVVGRVLQGEQVYAIYQRNVANPNTLAQRTARAKFRAAVELFRNALTAVKVGFAKLDGYKLGNPFSAAVGYNLKLDAFSVDAQGNVARPEWEVIQMSEGNLLNVYSPQANAENTDVEINWSDNSTIGNALANDWVNVVLINTTTLDVVADLKTIVRSERSSVVSAPSSWAGATVQVYVFCSNRTTGECSNSAHMQVTLS